MQKKKSAFPDSINAYIRVRPFSHKELQEGGRCSVYHLSSNEVEIDTGEKGKKKFIFPQIFKMEETQEEVFRIAAMPIIENVINDYNGTIFTYGQTGSGKTYTMLGKKDPAEEGIIPRVVSELSGIGRTVSCTYLEIYKEEMIDLFKPITAQRNKRVFTSKDIGTLSIAGAFKSLEHRNVTPENVRDLLEIGERNRHYARTALNSNSSRSHCVFTLEVKRVTESNGEITSKLNLVDLAGTEKTYLSKVEGENLEEAKLINKSLTTLGIVVRQIVNKMSHVNFRDSVLTRVLEDSLNGKSRTALVANISPSMVNSAESYNTLLFASGIQRIKLDLKRNIEVDYKALSRKLEDLIKNILQKKTDPRKIDFKKDYGIDIQMPEEGSEFTEDDYVTRLKLEIQSLEQGHQHEVRGLLEKNEDLMKKLEELTLKAKEAEEEIINAKKLYALQEEYQKANEMKQREDDNENKARILALNLENEELRKNLETAEKKKMIERAEKKKLLERQKALEQRSLVRIDYEKDKIFLFYKQLCIFLCGTEEKVEEIRMQSEFNDCLNKWIFPKKSQEEMIKHVWPQELENQFNELKKYALAHQSPPDILLSTISSAYPFSNLGQKKGIQKQNYMLPSEEIGSPIDSDRKELMNLPEQTKEKADMKILEVIEEAKNTKPDMPDKSSPFFRQAISNSQNRNESNI